MERVVPNQTNKQVKAVARLVISDNRRNKLLLEPPVGAALEP